MNESRNQWTKGEQVLQVDKVGTSVTSRQDEEQVHKFITRQGNANKKK